MWTSKEFHLIMADKREGETLEQASKRILSPVKEPQPIQSKITFDRNDSK